MKRNFKNEFNRSGFIVLKAILTNDEVSDLRNKVIALFKKDYQHSRMLMPSTIIKYFPEVLKIQLNSDLIDALKDIFGEDFHFVNDFQFHKNTSQLKHFMGWHIDAGSQVSSKNYKLYSKNYNFAKVGLCLQDSSPWGSSIAVSKFFYKSRIINAILHKILTNRFVPGFVSRFFTKECDEIIKAGDIYIFDCRLLHRSSIAKYNENRGNNTDYSLSNDSKLTLYFEAGDPISCFHFIENSYSRMLKEENFQGISRSEKYFSDYLRFTPNTFNDIDTNYLSRLKSKNVEVFFSNTQIVEKANSIY